jgi:hypothetical protein
MYPSNTILSLWRRFRQSGNSRGRKRSGRPRVTSRRLDNHIRLVHLRNQFQTSSLTAKSIPGLRPIISCHICKLSANDRCQTETLLHHVSLAARCLGSIIGRIADVLAWCYVHEVSGRPRVTSRRLDNHIRLVHLRNQFQTSSLTAKSIPGLRPISTIKEFWSGVSL